MARHNGTVLVELEQGPTVLRFAANRGMPLVGAELGQHLRKTRPWSQTGDTGNFFTNRVRTSAASSSPTYLDMMQGVDAPNSMSLLTSFISLGWCHGQTAWHPAQHPQNSLRITKIRALAEQLVWGQPGG